MHSAVETMASRRNVDEVAIIDPSSICMVFHGSTIISGNRKRSGAGAAPNGGIDKPGAPRRIPLGCTAGFARGCECKVSPAEIPVYGTGPCCRMAIVSNRDVVPCLTADRADDHSNWMI